MTGESQFTVLLAILAQCFIEVFSKADLCKNGCQQSPINIKTGAVVDVDLPALKFTNHWAQDICLTMFVAGETVLLKPPKECRMSMEGGPLTGSYVLDQVHFHWGETDNNGTEHCIDGVKLAMETHFVYMNCMFKCISEALGKPDGIAIVSIFIESHPTYHNCHFDPVTNNLCKLKGGASVSLKKNVLRAYREVAESNEYYTYEGSLTTPPCCEKVTWIIFHKNIKLNCAQVSPFRGVCNASGKQICRNWRPPQQLNGRIVYNAKATKCIDDACG